MLNLAKRTDEKAVQAKALLKKMGMDKSMSSNSPYWSVYERIFATGGHVAFALLLVWNPVMVVFTMPMHSAINSLSVKFMRDLV